LMGRDEAGTMAREIGVMEVQGLRDGRRGPVLMSLERLLSARIGKDADEPLVGPMLAERLGALAPWPGETRALKDWVAHHLAAAESLSGERLWLDDDGAMAQALMARLDDVADAYGETAARDYPTLFAAALAEAGDVPRAPYLAHERLAIWGTLEARAQSAETIVLGGLNEEIWPAAPAADPWLNRPMRERLGMASPERRIGLSAHDFQQAIAAPRAILSRSRKMDGAPTTPSRWLARLTTLLEGAAPDTLAEMRAQGLQWVGYAEALGRPDGPVAPAPRPAPTPPVAARPRKLSVTQIETLIRDPYSIYASKVLSLRRLEDPGGPADARLRGVTLHKVMERFVAETADWPGADAAGETYDKVARNVVGAAPAPAAQRRQWLARLERVKPWMLEQEKKRRESGAPLAQEAWGEAEFQTTAGPFTLVGVADRIDQTDEGLAIYDYKAGQAPTDKQSRPFAKQLPLLGAMAEAGAFDGFSAETTAKLAYLALTGRDEGSGKNGGKATEITPDPEVLKKLATLISAWEDEAEAYIPRAAPASITYEGDYDHLSRFGEWSDRLPEEEA
ncbi:MAG: PD-(D/E)XK nuclease family protein, partial [Pseudomonadota bacterium]